MARNDRNNIGFGFGSTGDARSARSIDRDAMRGNERVRFAAFAREYMMQVDAMATMAEIRAAFDRQNERSN